MATAHGALFCEVSARTGENVRKPYTETVDRIVQNPELLSAAAKPVGTVDVADSSGGYLAGCC